MFKKIHYILLSFGINLPRFFISLYDIPRFCKNLILLIKSKKNDSQFKICPTYPVLGENKQPGGTINSHYFIQDLYVAQSIYKRKPQNHFDIGSRVDGFIAHLATFMEVVVIDIREIPNKIDGIKFIQDDITKPKYLKENSIESLSSLHVFEHIGLGRYGDEIDYNGHIKALNSVHRLVMPNGLFYFSVPIGHQKIIYNAHRVFSISYLMKLLEKDWEIIEFSFIDDFGKLYVNQNIEQIASSMNFNFGCGIFILSKK